MPRLRILPLVLAMTLAACNAGATSSPGSDPTFEPTPSPAAVASTPSGSSAEPSVPATPTPVASSGLASDALHDLTLTDVRSGTQIRIGDLAADKPLLVETMAIWCTNCRAQMHNVVAAHDLADFHSLSIDVDPGELPGDLASYAEREGFDWPFAMADASLLGQLRDRFGTAVAVPPSMPKILFRTDGSVELVGLGELLSPEQIAAAVVS